MSSFDALNDLFLAGYPVINLQALDYRPVYDQIKAYCKEGDFTLYKWNCAEGLMELGLTFDTVMAVDDGVTDILGVLTEIDRRRDSREPEFFVIEGIFDFIYNAQVKVLLRKLASEIPNAEGKKQVLLLNAVSETPFELQRAVPALSFPLPGESELQQVLENVARKRGLDLGAELPQIIQAASGMTLREAELAFNLAAVQVGLGAGAAEVVTAAHSLRPDSSES